MSNIYTGTMGMISHIQKINMHSNNITNAETTGYKYDQETFRVFDESFKRVMSGEKNERIGAYNDQVYVDDIRTNFDPGVLKSTQKNLDFALIDPKDGETVSFFKVKKGDEEFLTRNGKFTVDADRRLVTHNGGIVMGVDGKEIIIPQGVSLFTQNDGTIRASNTNEVIGHMQIKSVKDEHLAFIEKSHGGLFKEMNYNDVVKEFGMPGDILEEYDRNPTIQEIFRDKNLLEDMAVNKNLNVLGEFEGTINSGLLEASNVNMTEEITGIMQAQKGVQMNQRSFSILNEILKKDANDVGRG